MSEANKTVVRRYIEEFVNTGDISMAPEFISPDFVHRSGFRGIEGYQKHVSNLRRAFSDFNVSIETLMGEKDIVAFYSLWSGTHTGPFMGIPPTGKKFAFHSTGFRRVRDGKIVEAWGSGDRLDWLEQLGIIPSPPESGEINKAIVRRFFDVMVTQNRPELASELVHPEFVRRYYEMGRLEERRGRGYITGAVTGLHRVFKGFHERVLQIVAEGDLVACRVDWGGVHSDVFRGVPATGREVDTESFRIVRIKDGMVIEMWSLGDNLGQLAQMGAIPPGFPSVTAPAAATKK